MNGPNLELRRSRLTVEARLQGGFGKRRQARDVGEKVLARRLVQLPYLIDQQTRALQSIRWRCIEQPRWHGLVHALTEGSQRRQKPATGVGDRVEQRLVLLRRSTHREVDGSDFTQLAGTVTACQRFRRQARVIAHKPLRYRCLRRRAQVIRQQRRDIFLAVEQLHTRGRAVECHRVRRGCREQPEGQGLARIVGRRALASDMNRRHLQRTGRGSQPTAGVGEIQRTERITAVSAHTGLLRRGADDVRQRVHQRLPTGLPPGLYLLLVRHQQQRTALIDQCLALKERQLAWLIAIAIFLHHVVVTRYIKRRCVIDHPRHHGIGQWQIGVRGGLTGQRRAYMQMFGGQFTRGEELIQVSLGAVLGHVTKCRGVGEQRLDGVDVHLALHGLRVGLCHSFVSLNG